MKYYWAGLLAVMLGILFLGLNTNTNSSDALGLLAFALIFAAIPFTIYKTFPTSRFAVIIALASPLILGLAWGNWATYIRNRQLDSRGVMTKGVVIAAWKLRTKNGGQQKLFKATFQAASEAHETASINNFNDFQKGDSIVFQYIPTDPNTYRIIGLRE
ncbi:hypothetical protein MUN81_17665 [Hymenobacter sp. 5317J-9]|uniref:hypothetical protein n=1 Tax=Hymenobacter sp. 5317J-9 TaxID=2932250 RepID=UPI001FD71BB6|nr:hypothetical protein [Hymenobacter sp. 5317J-9]UOQ97055.1 hypothetical protein MUN81_17665 [Hymenobacter sp. 5317J-9]